MPVIGWLNWVNWENLLVAYKISFTYEDYEDFTYEGWFLCFRFLFLSLLPKDVTEADLLVFLGEGSPSSNILFSLLKVKWMKARLKSDQTDNK